MNDERKSKKELIAELKELRSNFPKLDELQRQKAEIAAFLESSKAVLNNKEFKQTARIIFNTAKNLIGATAGYVALLSKDKIYNEVLFLEAGGLPCSVDTSLPMPIRGLRADAYRLKKSVYDNDFANSKWMKFMPQGHVRLDNVLFAPLIVNGESVGLLGIANKEGGFTDKDAELAGAFGELAAAALKNSRTIELLENSEERFRSVAENAGEAIITIDEEGIVGYWNNSAENIFGYLSDEIIGRPLTIIMPERFRQYHTIGFQHSLSDNESGATGKTVEFVGLAKSGKEIPIEFSISRWETKFGAFFTVILRDVTTRKWAEDALAWEAKVNEAIAELSEQLVSRMSIEEIAYNILEYAKRLTQSKFGFVGHIDPQSGHLVSSTLSRDIWELCQVQGKDVIFDHFSGLWGWVLNNREALMTNAPSQDSRSSGTPQGHIPIENFLSAPAMIEDTLVGQIALADSSEGYSGREVSIVERLANLYAIAVLKKRDEDALKQAATEWQTTFDSMSDSVFLIDKNYRILRYNQTASKLLDLESKKNMEMVCYNCVHKLDVPHQQCPHSLTLIDSKEHSVEVYEPLLDKYFFVTTAPTLDEGGNLIGSVHVMRDITYFKNAEEELKRHRDNLEGLVLERTAELTKTNDMLQSEIVEHERSEMEKEKAQRELEEQRTRSICSDRLRSLGEMAAGIAHELNQPLLGVRGLAEHILIGMDRGWDLSGEIVREKIKLIVDQADRMTHVIEHVRMFARGADEDELQPIDVNEVIESGLGLITTQLKSRGMKIDIVLGENLPQILANPFSLEEVILNLIGNARDAIEEKDITNKSKNVSTITVRTGRENVDNGEKVIIEVCDEGIGILPEIREKVFDPFFTTKDSKKGTGLGLAISKSIVEGFNGEIEIDSTPGVGTTVRISLPKMQNRPKEAQ